MICGAFVPMQTFAGGKYGPKSCVFFIGNVSIYSERDFTKC